MMEEEEVAWVVKEFASGRMQTDIGSELGYTAPSICLHVKRFCDRWSGVDVSARMAYGDERRHYARVALVNYTKQRTRIKRPALYVSSYQDRERAAATDEHAWLLRAEGLVYADIGDRLGVSRERAKQRVHKFGKRVAKAMRRTRVTIYEEGEEPPVRDWLRVATKETNNV
jgi:predicted DNA-binding protein (UPF0251 family)